jgi:hypothetical protein
MRIYRKGYKSYENKFLNVGLAVNTNNAERVIRALISSLWVMLFTHYIAGMIISMVCLFNNTLSIAKIILCQSRGSSGSIVSDYRLDDRAIEIRSLTGAEDFSSSPCIQTDSGAHPASYPMGTGGSFPGGKARLGRDTDHSPPSSAEVKNE